MTITRKLRQTQLSIYQLSKIISTLSNIYMPIQDRKLEMTKKALKLYWLLAHLLCLMWIHRYPHTHTKCLCHPGNVSVSN